MEDYEIVERIVQEDSRMWRQENREAKEEEFAQEDSDLCSVILTWDESSQCSRQCPLSVVTRARVGRVDN